MARKTEDKFVVVSFNGGSVLCIPTVSLTLAAKDFAHVRKAHKDDLLRLKVFPTIAVVSKLNKRRCEWNAYINGENDLSSWKAVVEKNHSKSHRNMLKLAH